MHTHIGVDSGGDCGGCGGGDDDGGYDDNGGLGGDDDDDDGGGDDDAEVHSHIGRQFQSMHCNEVKYCTGSGSWIFEKLSNI